MHTRFYTDTYFGSGSLNFQNHFLKSTFFFVIKNTVSYNSRISILLKLTQNVHLEILHLAVKHTLKHLKCKNYATYVLGLQ